MRRWHDVGDRTARDRLFERFSPLSRRLAHRYANSYEPLDDLVQVAAVGLLAAIDRFDPDRGVAFSSFAVPTILGELKRHFRNTGWSAHVPRGAQDLALRVGAAARQLTEQSGRSPSVEALAEYMNCSLEDVIVALDAGEAHFAVSLDAPAPAPATMPADAVALVDSLGGADRRFDFVEINAALAAAVQQLPRAQRRALDLRINKEMRQVDIARELGCSQMQVSRLLHRAAERLRALIDPELSADRAAQQ